MLQIWQLTPIMAALRRLREEEDWRIELQVSLGYTARLLFLRKRKTNNYCIKVFEDIWIIVKRENQSIKFRECAVPLTGCAHKDAMSNPVSGASGGQRSSFVSALTWTGSIRDSASWPWLPHWNQTRSTVWRSQGQLGETGISFQKADSLDGWVLIIEKYPKQRVRHTAQSTWSVVLNMDFFNSTHD